MALEPYSTEPYSTEQGLLKLDMAAHPQLVHRGLVGLYGVNGVPRKSIMQSDLPGMRAQGHSRKVARKGAGSVGC